MEQTYFEQMRTGLDTGDVRGAYTFLSSLLGRNDSYLFVMDSVQSSSEMMRLSSLFCFMM